MSLKGNLASVNLTEIFQMLSLSGREGTLFIYEGARKRAICFTKDGVSIRSRERNESNLIGKILVRLAKVEENQLQNAIEKRRSTNRLLGDVLVEMEACSRDDVEMAFRIQSEEDIQEPFLNRSDAQFEYVDGYFPESDLPFVTLNVNSLLIEIARRTDEWEYIRRRIRGPREIYRFTGVEGSIDAEIIQECYPHRVDAVIDGTRSVGEVIDISYVNKFEVCKLLAAYLDANVIELVPPDAIRQNAKLALRMGDAESAIRHYEYLMSSGDFPLDIMSEAAEAHEAARDFSEAAALLRRLGEELVRAGDYRGAIDSLRRVANYPRPEPEALRYLMELVFENPRSAAEFSGHIIEAGKTLVAYCVQHDQRHEALDLIKKLLRSFPDEVGFAISLVNIYYEEGQVEKAVAECERMANAFLKRKRPSPAVSLFKKLLVIDPERSDVRDRIRRIISGKKRRPSSAMPRIAVALAVALLLSGVAVVFVRKEGTGATNTGGMPGPKVAELIAGALNEQAVASRHSELAVDMYLSLMKRIVDLKLAVADAFIADIATAEENYRFFGEHAERAQQMAEIIRTQTADEETRARARTIVSTMKESASRIDSTRGQWRAMSQSAALKYFELGKKDYESGKLSTALKLFTLARALATNRAWAADRNIERYINNIRGDVLRVERRLKTARKREQEQAWTTARRIYLDLLENFPSADLVKDIRLPVEILTVPPGASIWLDGVETGETTPAFVHLPWNKETSVSLRKASFKEKDFVLGRFGKLEGTDAAQYTYTEALLKAATWVRNIRVDLIESTPVAWAGRAACVGRNGRWYVFEAASGRQVATDKLDTFDGVSAGMVTDGSTFFIPSLDGKLFAFHNVSCKPRYTVSGFKAGIYARPVIKGGIIYVVDFDGNVSARDLAHPRKRLWRLETPHGVRAAPVVQGEDLVVVAVSGDVTVIRRATGDKVIQYRLKGNSFSNAPAVAGASDLIFATEDGLLYGVERITGTVRWQRDLRSPVMATGPVRGRGAFFSPKPGELTAVDANTGDVIYHSTPSSDSARQPVASKGRVFFVHGRTLTAFAPVRGTEGYGLAWSFQAKGRILAGPVASPDGEAVYIGDEKGNFYRLEAND